MNIGQVSWKRALGVFNARLANAPPEHRTKLRHWKEAVTEIYTGFEAELLIEEPTILTLRAVTVDGRTGESRYPNLMISESVRSIITSTERVNLY